MIHLLNILFLSCISVVSSNECYPQGPCDDGFMDTTNGEHAQWAYCNACVGGDFYVNSDCQCACISSFGCSTNEGEGDNKTSGGAIAGIIILSVLLCCCGCIGRNINVRGLTRQTCILSCLCLLSSIVLNITMFILTRCWYGKEMECSKSTGKTTLTLSAIVLGMMIFNVLMMIFEESGLTAIKKFLWMVLWTSSGIIMIALMACIISCEGGHGDIVLHGVLIFMVGSSAIGSFIHVITFYILECTNVFEEIKVKTYPCQISDVKIKDSEVMRSVNFFNRLQSEEEYPTLDGMENEMHLEAEGLKFLIRMKSTEYESDARSEDEVRVMDCFELSLMEFPQCSVMYDLGFTVECEAIAFAHSQCLSRFNWMSISFPRECRDKLKTLDEWNVKFAIVVLGLHFDEDAFYEGGNFELKNRLKACTMITRANVEDADASMMNTDWKAEHLKLEKVFKQRRLAFLQKRLTSKFLSGEELTELLNGKNPLFPFAAVDMKEDAQSLPTNAWLEKYADRATPPKVEQNN